MASTPKSQWTTYLKKDKIMCKNFSYDDIQKWLKWFCELNIYNHFKEIFNFFFHPMIFWTHYDKMSAKDKIVQFITYAGIYIIIFLLCGTYSHAVDSIKVLLTELLSIIPFVLCIVLSIVFAQIPNIKNESISRCVLLGVYSYLIFIPFQILFLTLFYNSENYLFYAIACIVSIVAEIYMILVSLRMFIGSKKRKIIYVCAILSLFTIVDLSMDKLGFVSRSTNNTDIIAQERFELGKSIKNPYMIPTHVVSNNGEVIFYLYSSPIDSVAEHKYSEKIYFEELKSDIDSIIQIIPKTKYKTNHDFFNSLYILKKSINNVHTNKLYKNNPIIKNDTIWHDKYTYTSIDIREFSTECSQLNTDILRKEIQYQTTFENAQKVWYLRCLYHPYILYKVYKDMTE